MTQIFDINLKLEGQWGALPAVRLRESYDRVIAVPFEFNITRSDLGAPKIGVFAHIFYPDLAPEMKAALANIPVNYDLHISTNTQQKADMIADVFKDFPAKRLNIQVFENRGRDIAPFLVGFSAEIAKYDHVLHIHSKQSPHDDILNGWREYSFAHLLGSKAIVASILHMLAQGDVDCVYPDHYAPVRQSLNFGYDFDLMQGLLRKMGVELSKDLSLEFPSGSMFWANSRALKPFADIGLTFSDFPDEEGQVDGTLAHAIERSILYVVESVGGRYARIAKDDLPDTSRLIVVRRAEDVKPAVNRVYRRLLGNRFSVGQRVNYMDEICNVQLRPEASQRQRFTLLLPTLNPEKVFGGISSAIRLFREMAAKLGDDVDYRIVSLNEPVDIPAMSTVPDFTLLSLGAHNTELPRTVMDASGVKEEALPIRQNEVIMTTAWWTTVLGFRMKDMQKLVFGVDKPIVYLIQDHEPDFYGWSSRYSMAQSTYMREHDTIAVINSEELTEFCSKRYKFRETLCMTYRVNETLRSHFVDKVKEKTILIYGRPSVARNAFETLMDGLCLWQQNNPTIARDWNIISLGETYPISRASHVSNLSVLGTVSLAEYADLLSRASIGVSLMISPHPSYPPLEMAEAGLYTITNTYDGKDLTQRSSNFENINVLTAEHLAAAIARCVEKSASTLGKPAQFGAIQDIDTNHKKYTSEGLASLIRGFL
ncbi:rhamnosyltransferase WsaF family glycosyltransferase [Asticcacaulis taihuensis]|uniref:rhamnosyltransferase WsaF family glycosyltransferase n=1 Tax=Asticcacaulis taihuensis TaxID=260084 RepID=UPI003F7B5898